MRDTGKAHLQVISLNGTELPIICIAADFPGRPLDESRLQDAWRLVSLPLRTVPGA